MQCCEKAHAVAICECLRVEPEARQNFEADDAVGAFGQRFELSAPPNEPEQLLGAHRRDRISTFSCVSCRSSIDF